MRRLSTLAVTALAAATCVGLLGGVTWVFDLFAHFRIQLGLGLLVCLVVSWRLRQPRTLGLAAVALFVNFAIVAPQLVYQPTAEARGTHTLRLVHVNVNYHNREFESALELFREVDPDVVLIVEANELWMAALEPLKAELPYTTFVRHRRSGVALMSRYPMTAEGEYFSPRNPSIVARVDTPNGVIRVLGTHAWSPVGARRAQRRDDQLAAIASYLRRSDEPTVLLGDLNTTPWGHAFRSLVAESGLRDSSRGVGFQWSWPSPFWPLAIPIDHALVSDNVNVVDRRMGRTIGSDHLPLVIDISLTSTTRLTKR
jgi:endonuclease/exonuclease/phosphatase (EEP) superfamily protein YafD